VKHRVALKPHGRNDQKHADRTPVREPCRSIVGRVPARPVGAAFGRWGGRQEERPGLVAGLCGEVEGQVEASKRWRWSPAAQIGRRAVRACARSRLLVPRARHLGRASAIGALVALLCRPDAQCFDLEHSGTAAERASIISTDGDDPRQSRRHRRRGSSRWTEMSPYIPQAVIAIEDRRFYSHFGIDPIGLARAMMTNRDDRGGWSRAVRRVTQQLAKNLFLSPEQHDRAQGAGSACSPSGLST
jgi:hypothetical protein